MQNAIAATGTLLAPDALLGRATKKSRIQCRKNMIIGPQVGNEIDTNTTCRGDNSIVFSFKLINSINVFTIALANQRGVKNLGFLSGFFQTKTDKRCQDLSFPLTTGGTHCYTAPAGQHKNLFTILNHFNYFSQRLSFGNNHLQLPQSRV
jgi:hypothetical protein